MFMGNDVLSPFVNLCWLAVALLAAWCIGRPFGVAPVTLTGAAVLLATPGLVATQPGGAYNDVVGLALLLSCAALLVTAVNAGGPTRVAGQAIAALAAGVALGTKLTFIAPVGALTVGIWVLARRGRRLSEGGLWFLLLAVTGGFWYLRNLITVGNPLPSLNIKLGPLALPSPAVTTPSSTFAHFLLDGNAWHHYFLPGLRSSFGPAWWALLALAAAGLILGAAAGPGRMPKMLAWVGLVAAAAFVITPQYLAILGAPVFFVDNIRYVDPAILFGLVLLPLIPALRVKGRSWWLLGAYGAILALTQLDGTIWPSDLLAQRFAPPIGGIDSLIGLLVGVVVLGTGLLLYRWPWGRPGGRTLTLVVAAIGIALAASGFSLQQFYLRNRYTASNSSAVAWAQHVSNVRIGVAGDLTQLQYGLYGRYLTNYVQYVAQGEPHSGYAPITSCERWRQTVNAGHYDYVLTSTGFVGQRQQVFDTPSSYTVWTGADRASTLILRGIAAFLSNTGGTDYVGFSLFRLHGNLDPATCGDSGVGTAVPSRAEAPHHQP